MQRQRQEQRHKKVQEECVNVYGLKCPLAHDTHCPREDKDKDKDMTMTKNLKYPIFAIFSESRHIKDIKYHI